MVTSRILLAALRLLSPPERSLVLAHIRGERSREALQILQRIKSRLKRDARKGKERRRV
jgi:ribosomal protein L22